MRKDELDLGDIVLLKARVIGIHTGRFPIDIKLLGNKSLYVGSADIIQKVKQ